MCLCRDPTAPRHSASQAEGGDGADLVSGTCRPSDRPRSQTFQVRHVRGDLQTKWISTVKAPTAYTFKNDVQNTGAHRHLVHPRRVGRGFWLVVNAPCVISLEATSLGVV